MKTLFTLLLLAAGIAPASAQYQTPGTGVRWTLAQLAAATGSNVASTGPGQYAIAGNLRLRATDTLVISTNATVRIASLAEINIDGVLLVNPPDSVKFTAQTSTAPFHSFWFSATSNAVLRKTIVEYGGGLKTVDAGLLLDSCVVRYQVARIGTVNTNSGAINISGGAPRILNSLIYGNARSAIASPSNRPTAPIIRNCVIRDNNTENGNYPQINLGIGGATPTVITGNRVIGRYNMAGGIAISNLLGTAAVTDVEIRRNYVANNRYGIAVLGSNITSRIVRNIVENNNTNPNANTGGSGLNFQGGATNTGVVSRNILRGNLWGVTMLRTSTTSAAPGPTVSFGDVSSPDSLNVGLNLIYNNGNGGQVYDFYLNMPDNVMAQNNDWGSSSAAVIESHIVHQVDQPSLGLLSFQPFRQTIVSSSRQGSAQLLGLGLGLYPNPAREQLLLRLEAAGPATVQLRDAQGRVALRRVLTPAEGHLRVPVSGLAAGLYTVEVEQQGRRATAKVAIGE
ncbi:T9SS type A sorting domain-containing protein [Hymenobacter saemangeumensis]